MKKINFYRLLGLLACMVLALHMNAQVSLPKIFGSNMVLQRDKPLPIWGLAKAGERVTVKFGKQSKQTFADSSGNWKVLLSPLKGSVKPTKMVISGTNTITLDNILVGEVWLCSGQSNMEYTMRLMPKYRKPNKGVNVAEEEIKSANNPNIRIFLVEKKLSTPDVTTKGWNIARDSALMSFSAIGYFYGKELFKELNVPIGIISSAWGGSRIEPWTPAEAYSNSTVFKEDAGKEPGKMDGMTIGHFYKSMIRPLAPYSIRGFIWYQGESNCMLNETFRYTDKMQVLIDNWRSAWFDQTLPFYYVQIAPYYYTRRKDKLTHTPATLAEFWEAQTKALNIPHTGMAVVNDLVDTLIDIHPSYKWEVAHRLALWALAKNYGKNEIEYSGPIYKQMKTDGDKIELEFSHCSNGLISKDSKPLVWFTIAGTDGKYFPAEAIIEGNKVIVSSTEVGSPSSVRFAWDETAMPNLANKEGLPALPFRTDSPEWVYKEAR